MNFGMMFYIKIIFEIVIKQADNLMFGNAHHGNCTENLFIDIVYQPFDLLHADFLLDLFYNPEVRDMFLRNVG
jgi:hypothetical protein